MPFASLSATCAPIGSSFSTAFAGMSVKYIVPSGAHAGPSVKLWPSDHL